MTDQRAAGDALYGFTVDLDNALDATRATQWYENGGGDPDSEQGKRVFQEAYDTRQEVIAQYEALLGRTTPTEDERAGMEWWNGLTESVRGQWLEHARNSTGGASAADAWACYKRTTPTEAPSLSDAVTDEEVALAICSYNNWSRDMLVPARSHVKYADTRACALRHVLKDFLNGRATPTGRRDGNE